MARALLLGGGVFLGRHLAEAFSSAGYEVTAFHRGISSSGALPPGVRVIRGDRGRRDDLAAVAGARWDVIVDTCGYLPEHVRLAATLIRCGRYVFISSVSVYRSFAAPNDERSELVAPAYPDRISGACYGAAKVACELSLADNARAPFLIVRCGLLTGPHDVSSAARYGGRLGPADLDYDAFAGRLPYWPWRFSRPGLVLVPGRPTASVQVLDARDLAAWLAAVAADHQGGTVNAVGAPATFGEWIEACQSTAEPRGSAPVWIDDEALLAAGMRPGLDLPLWNPPAGGAPAFFAVDGSAVRAQGLRTRPLAHTVGDVARWMADPALNVRDIVGEHPLDADREQAALRRLASAGSGRG